MGCCGRGCVEFCGAFWYGLSGSWVSDRKVKATRADALFLPGTVVFAGQRDAGLGAHFLSTGP